MPGAFDHVVDPKPGDFVYCDPPYDGGFVGYTPEGFGMDMQTRLRDSAIVWKERGAEVLISNADTPAIRELYRGFEIVSVEAPRPINADPKGRGAAKEVLVRIRGLE